MTKGHIIYKKMVRNNVELDISSEFDIILYDINNYPAFPWNASKDLIALPYESVIGVMEVKSTLNDRSARDVDSKNVELERIHASTQEVLEKDPRPSTLPDAFASDQDLPTPPPPPDPEPESRPILESRQPFFMVFSFREKLSLEPGAGHHFSRHAGLTRSQPDALINLKKTSYFKRSERMRVRLISLAHGSTQEHSEDSRENYNDIANDEVYSSNAYRRDYIAYKRKRKSDLIATFLNVAYDMCLEQMALPAPYFDPGYFFGLWLRQKPVRDGEARRDIA